MKLRLSTLLPALIILAAGAYVLRSQRLEIAALRNSSPVTSMASLPETTPPLKNAPAKSAAASDKSLTKSTTGDARAAAFIDSMREQARPFIDKADREGALRAARFKADRVALLLSLTPAETGSLRSVLEKHTGPGLSAVTREWIAQNRGEDTAQKFDAAEAASRTAAIEHDSQDAIFRVSRIVDLTPEQKDRLYAAFVRKASATPETGPVPSDLLFSFSLQDTPSISNPAELARPLLTPEQLALFDASRAQENKAVADSTGEVMGQILPAIVTALRDAGKE